MRRDVRTAGPVKESITSLDGVVDCVCAGSIVNLPQTEPNLWHLVAIIQSDIGSFDSHCSEKMTFYERWSKGSSRDSST